MGFTEFHRTDMDLSVLIRAIRGEN